ncbi:hypothetical protein C8R42DRAFT_630292 [Lentinula raphanica]|nr:hypothetical protein C8R42DRAFT_630292 [Lentinula raphanica]
MHSSEMLLNGYLELSKDGGGSYGNVLSTLSRLRALFHWLLLFSITSSFLMILLRLHSNFQQYVNSWYPIPMKMVPRLHLGFLDRRLHMPLQFVIKLQRRCGRITWRKSIGVDLFDQV